MTEFEAATDNPDDSYGPYRLEFRVTLPDNYEERWVSPPGGGLPGAQVSELQVALGNALAAETAPIRATVTTTAQTGGSTARTGDVYLATTSTYRGPGDPEAAPANPGPDTWTAEVRATTPEPPTVDLLDYAVIARRWAQRVASITTDQDVTMPVVVTGVWLAQSYPPQPLPEGYPAGTNRTIEFPVEG